METVYGFRKGALWLRSQLPITLKWLHYFLSMYLFCFVFKKSIINTFIEYQLCVRPCVRCLGDVTEDKLWSDWPRPGMLLGLLNFAVGFGKKQGPLNHHLFHCLHPKISCWDFLPLTHLSFNTSSQSSLKINYWGFHRKHQPCFMAFSME